MPDPIQMIAPETTDPVTQAAFERISDAVATLNDLNRSLPPGVQPFAPDPLMEIIATQDVLLDAAKRMGWITQDDFTRQKAVKYAEMVERLATTASEAKRELDRQLLTARPGQMVGPNGQPLDLRC